MGRPKNPDKARPGWGNWKSMCGRCSDASSRYYGGKGITVCERWKASFQAFIDDMGEPPFEGAQIDRIDASAGYSPTNCRWVSAKENIRARSCTTRLVVDGVTKTMPEWCEELGVSFGMVRDRIRNGWDHKRALTEPRGPRGPKAKAIQ